MAFLRLFAESHKYLNIYPRISPRILVSALNHYGEAHRHLTTDINPRVEARLKRKDGIDDSCRIVYRAPYETYCKTAYVISIVSSTVFPALFSSLIFNYGWGNFPYTIGEFTVVNTQWEIVGFALGLAILIGNLSLVIFRYPYRIYRQKNGDNYILIYQHYLPWKYNKECLKAGELEKDRDVIFSWNESVYKFRERRAIILEDKFHIPSDFFEMLSDCEKKRK